MKMSVLLVMSSVCAAHFGHAQGLVVFDNLTAPTRIGSTNGPLAGTGIWAQMLAGPSPGTLVPLGMPAEHLDSLGVPTGRVFGGIIAVPGIPGGQTAFVEMLAWDGARWGTALSGVPNAQLGMTDIVPVGLADLNFGPPAYAPPCTLSAVVPVAEPTALAIGILAAAGTLLRWAVRRRLGSVSGRLAHRPNG